jgi:hypothetical protein
MQIMRRNPPTNDDSLKPEMKSDVDKKRKKIITKKKKKQKKKQMKILGLEHEIY